MHNSFSGGSHRKPQDMTESQSMAFKPQTRLEFDKVHQLYHVCIMYVLKETILEYETVNISVDKTGHSYTVLLWIEGDINLRIKFVNNTFKPQH